MPPIVGVARLRDWRHSVQANISQVSLFDQSVPSFSLSSTQSASAESSTFRSFSFKWLHGGVMLSRLKDSTLLPFY